MRKISLFLLSFIFILFTFGVTVAKAADPAPLIDCGHRPASCPQTDYEYDCGPMPQGGCLLTGGKSCQFADSKGVQNCAYSLNPCAIKDQTCGGNVSCCAGLWLSCVDPNDKNNKNPADGKGKCIVPPSSSDNAPSIPCVEGTTTTANCTKISTALGDIGVQPGELVKSVFAVILSFTGLIALLIIIISGYKLMASQGNPEQLQGTKEQLTAAIVGLLFIIFSLIILQIVGVNIIGIPGFSS